jgi:hypothetical protein
MRSFISCDGFVMRKLIREAKTLPSTSKAKSHVDMIRSAAKKIFGKKDFKMILTNSGWSGSKALALSWMETSSRSIQ